MTNSCFSCSTVTGMHQIRNKLSFPRLPGDDDLDSSYHYDEDTLESDNGSSIITRVLRSHVHSETNYTDEYEDNENDYGLEISTTDGDDELLSDNSTTLLTVVVGGIIYNESNGTFQDEVRDCDHVSYSSTTNDDDYIYNDDCETRLLGLVREQISNDTHCNIDDEDRMNDVSEIDVIEIDSLTSDEENVIEY